MKAETAGVNSEPSMKASTRSAAVCAHMAVAGAWGVLCSMILAVPILLANSCHKPAALLHYSFSYICHQIPERSFFLLGYSLPVCHRCSGIYLGFFLGSLVEIHFAHRSPRARRIWVMAACIPMLADGFLSYSGLWPGTGPGRFFTGFWFGSLISTLLVRGVAELLTQAPWRRTAGACSPLKKGYTWIQKEC